MIPVAVVVAFFICWAPFHAQRLYAIYGLHQQAPVVMLQIYEIMTYISGILYYVSTTINPILYHTMSLKFRDAFKVSSLQQNFVSCPSYKDRLWMHKFALKVSKKENTRVTACKSKTERERDASCA
jgi:hypothetical protein